MTWEEALALPGRKVHVTDEEVKDGKRTVLLYDLQAGGAAPVATAVVPVAEHAMFVRDLVARGCELADSELLTNVVWIPRPDGVEVYDRRRRILVVAGDRATLHDGRVVLRSELARVYTWASEDYAHRGIRATLRSGEDIDLVIEISLAATGDPTYGRNELLFDTSWCTTLGRLIAAWAGTELDHVI